MNNKIASSSYLVLAMTGSNKKGEVDCGGFAATINPSKTYSVIASEAKQSQIMSKKASPIGMK
jgi:hypothetical protein